MTRAVDRLVGQPSSNGHREEPDREPSWMPEADIHFQPIAGGVPHVPGAGTEGGDRAISNVVRHTLDRVRRSIRDRALAH